MLIHWNSIPNGSWEITPSRILVRQSLGMVGEAVSPSVSLLPPMPQLGRMTVLIPPVIYIFMSRSRDQPRAIDVVAHLRHGPGGA